MKEVLKEIKNIFALGWYEFRKALEWIDSKIQKGTGNNTDARYEVLKQVSTRDSNGTITKLKDVYSDEFLYQMEQGIRASHSDKER